MKVIPDLKTAKEAMTLIVEQGEGRTVPDQKQHSHYEIFKELHSQDELVTYPVPQDPKTKAYEGFDVHTVRDPVSFSRYLTYQ
jgi:hypothetical protein